MLAERTRRTILRPCLRHWRCEEDVAPRTRKRVEAASDGGRNAEPLDDHAGALRNRGPQGPARAPRASAACLDSLQPCHIGAERHPDAVARAPRRGDPAVHRGVNATSPFTKTRLSTGC